MVELRLIVHLLHTLLSEVAFTLLIFVFRVQSHESQMLLNVLHFLQFRL